MNAQVLLLLQENIVARNKILNTKFSSEVENSLLKITFRSPEKCEQSFLLWGKSSVSSYCLNSKTQRYLSCFSNPLMFAQMDLTSKRNKASQNLKT